MNENKEKECCNDCQAKPGENHLDGCDVERCGECGGQFISCCCKEPSERRVPWSGEWPGTKECREFGWYCFFIKGVGWIECNKDNPKGTEDLNRLHRDAVWNKEKAKFVLP